MTLQSLRQKYFGDRAFYRMVLRVAVPMMLQNSITNFVSLLDNLMVGQTGTESIGSVAIVNVLLFVFNLCIFGGLGGIGIFTAQYAGRKDHGGIRDTFRAKLWLALLLTGTALFVFLRHGGDLILLYLQGSPGEGDAALTLSHGLDYLRVMLLGLPAFAAAQLYTSTLRENSETLLPMKAGLAAVFTNLLLNWLLIGGHWGAPALGVVGAAIATVVSRWVELLIVVLWTHTHPDRCPWIRGMYATLRVPAQQLRAFFRRGFPLLLNEAFWSAAIAMLNQCYSTRGLDVVAAMNISSTINNLFNMLFATLGSSIGIIVGQLLGAGKLKEAKETDTKMIVFSIMVSLGTGLLLVLTSPLFPRLYNTSQAARDTARLLILVTACFTPCQAFTNACYFTLRSGGKTFITFLFDSVFICLVSVPIALYLSRRTALSAPWIMTLVNAGDLLKCVVGYVMVRRNLWIHRIVDSAASPEKEAAAEDR